MLNDLFDYQVGAFVTLLHNMGFIKAVSFNDKFTQYQTIAIERGYGGS